MSGLGNNLRGSRTPGDALHGGNDGERETAARGHDVLLLLPRRPAPPPGTPLPPRRPLTKVLSHGHHFKPEPQVQPDPRRPAEVPR